MVDKVVFWGLCLILALVPLPFGGNEEWAIFAFEAAVLALLALYVVGRAAGGPREDEDAGARERAIPLWVKALFAVFFAVSAAQILPLPAGVLGAVSPATQRFYQGIAGSGLTDLQGHAWKTVAFAPNLALYELLKIVCYGIFGFLIMRTARTRARVKVLVFVVVLSGVFQAVYGLGELWSGTGRIFGWKNRRGQGSAFGTFINRDHYSAFLEMIFPLALGYLLARADFFAMKKGLTLREKFLWFGQERFQKLFVAGLLAAVVGVGLLFSRSLSGIIIFSVSLVLMSTLLSLSGGKRRGGGGRGREEHVEPAGREGRAEERGDRVRVRRSRRSVRTVALAVVLAVVLIGVQPILQSLKRKEFTLDKGRAVYYRNTVEMIEAYAEAGIGLGSFSYIYPLFQKEYEKGLLDHAHNDYLEVMAESGVAGGGALVAGALALLALLAVRWARRRDSLVRGVGVGCLVGVLAMLIHSGSDFSLRMPANAVYFVTLYALGLSVVGLGRVHTARTASALGPGGGSSRRRTRTTSIVFGALLLAGTGGLIFAVVKQNMAYRCLDKYEAERAALAREGKRLLSGFDRLEGLLVKGVGWSKNPVIYGELARLYAERASVENEKGLPGLGGTRADARLEARTEGLAEGWEERRDIALDKARGVLVNQIEANPADARGYFEMGNVMMLYNYPLLTYAEQGRQYMRKALELKRHNIVLNVNAMFTHLAQWEGMGDAERAWVMRWLATVWAGVEVNAKAFWPELRKRWKSAGGDLEGLRAILRGDGAVWASASKYL